MTRRYEPVDLVALPRLDAASAVTLANAVVAAAKHKDVAKHAKKEKSVMGALDGLAAAASTLEGEIGPQTVAPRVLRDADRVEDNAVGALFEVLGGWARLDGATSQGTAAAQAKRTLFGDSQLGEITQAPTSQEWALVQGLLGRVDTATKSALDAIGAAPLIAHLRDAHAKYGVAVGATAPKPVEEPPAVAAARTEVLDSLRDYVLQVTAAVRRKTKPLAAEVSKALLRPIADWEAQQASPVAPPSPTPAVASAEATTPKS